MEPATTVTREIVSNRMSPVHVLSVPPVMSAGLSPAGVQPLSDLNGGSSSSSSPPPMQTDFTVVDGPSPADGLGSSPADGLRSFPPVLSGMSEGPLPAGVQPLCSSSSNSSPPPIQAGLKVVDGPSPADGLGSHGSASTAEMSPESRTPAHLPRSARTRAALGLALTDLQVGRFFMFFALVLCTIRLVQTRLILVVFIPLGTEMRRLKIV